LPLGDYIYWQSVTYGNNIFVAVSSSNNSASSTDGITWTGQGIAALPFSNSILWSGTQWVVGVDSLNNAIYTSSDGISWTARSTATSCSLLVTKVAWNGNKYVAVGQGTSTVATSTNGTTWTASTNVFAGSTGYGVAWNGNLWIITGEGTSGDIATSPDTISWTTRSVTFTPDFGSCAVSRRVLPYVGTSPLGGGGGGPGGTGPTGPAGPLGTSTEARLTIQTVSGTSLTGSTIPSISLATYTTYYSITNSGFNALTLPASPETGAFWVLRNNSSAYLTFNPTYTSGSGPTTITIPPSTGVTIAWSGSAFVLF
jgi:hypothetical protein